ncbi:MAG: hypothetical protein K2G03_05045 [Bacilli bacterium]|nr:hypothetical protein [Bacilli bacterium]
MNRIAECYDSLKKAKDELDSLENKKERGKELFRKYYMFDVAEEQNMPIKALMVKLDAKHKEQKKILVLIFALGYPAILLFWVIVSFIFGFNTSVCVSISSSFIVTSNLDRVDKVKKCGMKRKYLDEVLAFLGNDEENLELSIGEIIAALNARDIELDEEIADKKKALEEYEKLLEGVRQLVANEIISSHGIDAELTVDFAKNPKRFKTLIKKNVNK